MKTDYYKQLGWIKGKATEAPALGLKEEEGLFRSGPKVQTCNM